MIGASMCEEAIVLNRFNVEGDSKSVRTGVSEATGLACSTYVNICKKPV